MSDESLPVCGYRSGFVAIVGRPNVGKSTLLNALVGEHLAIITPKPQTTRNRILGIWHHENGQVVFLDTPGVHKAKGALNQYMVDTAIAAVSEADVVYFMLEVGPSFMDREELGESNELLIAAIKNGKRKVFLLLNKIDLIPKEQLLPFIERISTRYGFDEVFPISALKKKGLDQLRAATLALLPEGPAYYPEDMITDKTMRFLAAETVREKTLLLLREEVPYSVGVEVERFSEMDDGTRLHIEAVIFVERDSQKGIVIGKGGQMLKAIGAAARLDMEKHFEKPVGLKLVVRVRKDWTLDPAMLDRLGYVKA